MQFVRQMLLHARQQTARRARHNAFGRRNGAVQRFQKRAFAAAVMTDKANAVAFFQGKGKGVQHRAKRGINAQGVRRQ